DDRLDHASRANRLGELGERGFVHAGARLVFPGPQALDGQLREPLLLGGLGRRAEKRIQSPPESLVPRHRLQAASATATPFRARSSRANCRCAVAPLEAGSCRRTGFPNDGASAMRMLRGITVSKTLSP